MLPTHGRVPCTKCFDSEPVDFDCTKIQRGDWRITSNPLAWGSTSPEIVVLGFSKGPTQAGALATSPHNEIAYKGSRRNVGKILAHVGLLSKSDPHELALEVDHLIAQRDGRFHFGSLIRCTVERFDKKTAEWKGSGGGMLDRFLESELGRRVASNCGSEFLGELPASVRLVVMFGLGTKLNYVHSAMSVFKAARPADWTWINDVAYTDGRISVVHVEHFASQGALIPNWLGENKHDRSELGVLAKVAVAWALR